MNLSEWDDLEAMIATFVFEYQVPMNEAVVMACRAHPQALMSSLLMAAIAFATHTEAIDNSSLVEKTTRSLSHHKVVAALAADTMAVGPERTFCADLLEFWHQTSDQFFLG